MTRTPVLGLRDEEAGTEPDKPVETHLRRVERPLRTANMDHRSQRKHLFPKKEDVRE